MLSLRCFIHWQDVHYLKDQQDSTKLSLSFPSQQFSILVNLYNLEDSMRSWRMIMTFLFSISSLILSLVQKIKGFFNIRDRTLRKTLHILINNFKINWTLLKKIIDLLIIYLKIRDIYCHIFIFFAKDISQRKKDKSLSLLVSKHCISLSRSCLPIHKNSWVTSIQKLLHDFLATFTINFMICMNIPENIVKWKLINIVHFNFALLSLKRKRILPQQMTRISISLSPGQRWYFSRLLIDGPSLNIFILIDERSHSDSDLDFLVFLH